MEYTQQQLQICIDGRDESVRGISEPIPVEDITTPEMQQYFDDLIEAMMRYDGIGIASPQVGFLIQAVIIHSEYASEYTDSDEHFVLINPRIVSASPKSKIMEEGCLSVPGVFGPIERAQKVRVKGYDRHGNQVDIKTKSFLARVLQHEIDHLHGVLYVDNATELYERTISSSALAAAREEDL